MAIVARPPRARRAGGVGAALVLLVVSACGTSGPPASAGPSGPADPSGGPTASATASGPGTPPSCPPSPAVAPAGHWWDDRIFYEAFVRSFRDSNGDGIGDLNGLTQRLDYLNDGDPATTDDLGITGLWLMPVAQSPSYHGYDVTDYRTVNADYGSNDDFKRFIAAAHQRGIKVIVDFVVNHTSSAHPWFKDAERAGSPHDDWYVWSVTNPGYGGPDGQQVWHADRDGRFYYGVFGANLPDLNLRTAAVTSELESISRFWLNDMGADGFRLDAAKHLVEDGEEQTNTPESLAWLAGFRDDTHRTKTDALVLGEVYDTRLVTSRYVSGGALDAAFDFDFGGAVLSSLRLGDAGTLAAGELELSTRYPGGGAATFLSNHDQARFASQLGGDTARIRAAAAILLLAPGLPFVYYGEELGMTGTKPDERIRTPYPWTASGPGFGFTTGRAWETFAEGAETANVATESADAGSVLSTYRGLIRFRGTHPALATGALIPIAASSSSVAAFVRRGGGETLLVIHALSDTPTAGVTFDLPAGTLCGAAGASVLLGPDGGSAAVAAPVAAADGSVTDYGPLPVLPPLSSWVIRLSP